MIPADGMPGPRPGERDDVMTELAFHEAEVADRCGEASCLADPCRHGESAGRCAGCGVRAVSICSALEGDELEQLEALGTTARFAEKETMFLQDDAADWVYNLLSGMVRLYRLLPDGRRQIFGFLLPGDFMGLALSERYAFSADAVEPVSACRFARGAFSGLVDAKPHLLRRLHGAATHELTLAQDHMVLLGRRRAEERVAAFLIGMRQRMVLLGRSAVTLPLPMSRQDIADYLGLTIETVSRTFTRLAREKAIVIVPDGVRLLDAPRLEAMAAA